MSDDSHNGWCGWCFKKTSHSLIQQNYLRRNIYRCSSCFRRTLICRRPGCQDMARGHDTWDDEMCPVHDGSVRSWISASNPAELAMCSWCCNLTSHDLVQANVLRRNTYRCRECGQPTIQCRAPGCHDMARRHSTWDDEMCLKCDGTVSSWDKTELPTNSGWCSWCYHHGPHKLIEHNLTRRNIYQCENCNARTGLGRQ